MEQILTKMNPNINCLEFHFLLVCIWNLVIKKYPCFVNIYIGKTSRNLHIRATEHRRRKNQYFYSPYFLRTNWSMNEWLQSVTRHPAGVMVRFYIHYIDELQEIEEAVNANLPATKPKLSLIFFNPCLTFYQFYLVQ